MNRLLNYQQTDFIFRNGKMIISTIKDEKLTEHEIKDVYALEYIANLDFIFSCFEEYNAKGYVEHLREFNETFNNAMLKIEYIKKQRTKYILSKISNAHFEYDHKCINEKEYF